MSIAKSYIELAKEGVVQAGNILLGFYNHPEYNPIHRKAEQELVSQADLASEKFLRDFFEQKTPDSLFLSEETPSSHDLIKQNGTIWVIDPLDGTTNFLHRIPYFAITIALLIDGEIMGGIIYDPLHQSMWWSDNTGAFFSENKIKISDTKNPQEALLLAGKGHRHGDRERHAELLHFFEENMGHFRRTGCASLMLAQVASGTADASLLTGSQVWDMAAGAHIIRQAGGIVTDYCGQPWKPGCADLVATNGEIHDFVIKHTRRIHEYHEICSLPSM